MSATSSTPAATGTQRPAQREHEQAEVARVADGAIDAVCHQRMAGLDGDQPAEATAEHEDGPKPQRAAAGIEDNTHPADSIAVDGPELLALGVGRQPGDKRISASAPMTQRLERSSRSPVFRLVN